MIYSNFHFRYFPCGEVAPCGELVQSTIGGLGLSTDDGSSPLTQCADYPHSHQHLHFHMDLKGIPGAPKGGYEGLEHCEEDHREQELEREKEQRERDRVNDKAFGELFPMICCMLISLRDV